MTAELPPLFLDTAMLDGNFKKHVPNLKLARVVPMARTKTQDDIPWGYRSDTWVHLTSANASGSWEGSADVWEGRADAWGGGADAWEGYADAWENADAWEGSHSWSSSKAWGRSNDWGRSWTQGADARWNEWDSHDHGGTWLWMPWTPRRRLW